MSMIHPDATIIVYIARMAAEHKEAELHELSLLKEDGKGWKMSLFEDDVSKLLCAHCGSVPCNAAELGCDHDDDDILMYCHQCLRDVIQQNGGKCPLDGHSEPVISPSRASRRQISRSSVFCPYSRAYKQRAVRIDHGNGQIVDTVGGDERVTVSISAVIGRGT